MLQVYVYGPLEEGFLDINPETILNLEGLSEIFNEDLSTGEFSLPLEFPWTARNRRLLGFPERLENLSVRQRYWVCDVKDKGFPELMQAKLTMIEKIGALTYQNGKFNASISGTKGLFGSRIAGKTLKDLQLGGTITWADKTSRQFAEEVMKGLYPQYNYISFAPVAIEDFIKTDRPDYTTEFLAKDTVNNIIITGSGANDWTFARPLSTNETTPVAAGNAEYVHYRTVPFFNLKYVLRKAFLEFGFSLSGDFIDDADFNELVIFNNYGIENYAITISQDFNRTITPSNHVPALSIGEFIKAVFDFFNLYPTFNGINQVRISYRKNDLKNRRIMSLNDVCSQNFSSTTQELSSEEGYSINYVWDGNDSMYSDRVKDISDKTLVGTVATITNLEHFDIGRQLTTDDIAYVKESNLYYQVADGTSDPLKWDAYAENLNAFKKGNGERTIDVGLSTLCTYVKFNNDTALFEKQYYLGCRQGGSYINNKGVKVLSDFGLRIFYIKKVNIGTVEVPASLNHNRYNNNTKLLPFSLAWQGEEGMAANFHTAWQNVKETAEIVKITIKGSPKVLNEMAASNCFEINNVLFLPYKIERTIPLKTSMQVSLVPL